MKKTTKLYLISLIFIGLLILVYFTGLGFKTDYYTTVRSENTYGWCKKKGGFRYDSAYTYSTREAAKDAALMHCRISERDLGVALKEIIDEKDDK